MKKLKAVFEVENLVNKTLANAAAETKKLEASLKQERAEIDKANGEMDAATAAGDLKAYQAAKAARRNAADAKEMHEARLEILNGKALISKEQYEGAVNSIFAEIDALEEEVKQALTDYSIKMDQEAGKLQEAMESANKILIRLQSEVYRDQDRRRGPSGEIVRLPIETKQVDKWGTIHWGRRALQFKERTGK